MTRTLESPQPAPPPPDPARFRWDAILGWIQSHPARFLLQVFLALAATLTLILAARGTLGAPPAHPDAIDYDNIGFNLAQGRGFRFDWEDPEWRRLYEQDDSNRLQDFLSWRVNSWRKGSWATTFRPPMLPLLIAGNQLLFGRQFVTVRISNVLLIAGALCLAATVAMRVIGPLGAVLVPVLGMADRRMLAYSEAILTESLALFAVVLLTWLLARLLDRPSAGTAALAGATLGVALLCRSIFIFWYPPLLVGVFLLVRHARASANTRQAVALAALFIGAAVAVPAPWWVRNCLLLEAAMPLGTQGGATLPGAYSDAAWRSTRDRWADPNTWGLFDPLVHSESYRALPGHLQERERARFGARYTIGWIQQNPEKLLALAWHRIKDSLRPYGAYESVLLVLAFGGLLLTWRRPLALLLAGLFAINGLGAMTYVAAGGRYMIPVRGSLYVLAAVGLVGMGRWLACLRLPVASATCLRGTRRQAQTGATHRQAARIARRSPHPSPLP